MAGKCLSQRAVECGIACFPNAGSAWDFRKLDFPVFKREFFTRDLEEASALLVFGISACVENNAISSLEWNRAGFHLDMVMSASGDKANEGAAFFSKAGADEFLVVHAMHPALI